MNVYIGLSCANHEILLCIVVCFPLLFTDKKCISNHAKHIHSYTHTHTHTHTNSH